MKKASQPSFGLLIPKGNLTEDHKIQHVSFEYGTPKKMYQVWTEGYRATGEHGTATYHGECLAESFQEACEKLLGDSLDKNPDGTNRYPYPSVWACRFYDNEADARKSFG